MKLGHYQFKPTLVPRLAMVALLVLFVSLGNWQLRRAQFKQTEQDKMALNRKAPVVAITPSDKNLKAMIGRKTITPGRFDGRYEAALAYHKYEGRPGFLVLTPFRIQGSETRILVLRGWIEQTGNFNTVPKIPASEKGLIKLHGIVDRIPSVGKKSGKPDGRFANQWPKLLIYADHDWYEKVLQKPFLPYAVKQTFHNSPGLITDWSAFASSGERMPPEKHRGYAFQWFSLAIVLLILYFVLNTRSTRRADENE